MLITLLIKAGGPVPNTFLTKYHIGLRPKYREDLRKRGLIEVEEKPLVLELTEKGWGEAIKELGGEVPDGFGSVGGALYTALGFLRELLDTLDVPPSDLFALRVGKANHTPADFGASIRKAYGEVARSGEYVSLAKVREALRSDIDSTLVRMNREDDVNLIPNSQQGDLTEDDRAAAVTIGNQDRHLIAISS
nr:hypothetical protein [uncultured Actinoplanes sp.]